MSRLGELQNRLPPRLARWAPQLAAAEALTGVDALDLAAIMDRESRGGEALEPKGPAGTGDGGHGLGLMQIDDRAHARFTEGLCPDGKTPLWADPSFAVLFAARLVREDLVHLDGHRDAAICAYNAGPDRARVALADCRASAQAQGRTATPDEERAALDLVTTGHDYVSDVARRRAGFVVHP